MLILKIQLVSHRFILTVAHCFVSASSSSPGNILVLVGDHDRRIVTETPFSEFYTVAAIIRHELYNANNPTNANDIALLRTVNNIRFNRGIK